MKKHKCSQCGRLDATIQKISEKEKRWLCDYHVKLYQNKGRIAQAHFFKASEYLEK